MNEIRWSELLLIVGLVVILAAGFSDAPLFDRRDGIGMAIFIVALIALGRFHTHLKSQDGG